MQDNHLRYKALKRAYGNKGYYKRSMGAARRAQLQRVGDKARRAKEKWCIEVK